MRASNAGIAQGTLHNAATTGIAVTFAPSALPDDVVATAILTHAVHDDAWYDSMATLIWKAMSLCPPAPAVRHAYGRIETTPRSVAWVVSLSDEIADMTMLDDGECLQLMGHIADAADCTRHHASQHVRSAASLLAIARAYSLHADGEPRWHAELRGDDAMVGQQAWRLLMDVRDDAIGIARLRTMRAHVPRVVSDAERSHRGFAGQFLAAVDDAIARQERRTRAYDAMGNPL